MAGRVADPGVQVEEDLAVAGLAAVDLEVVDSVAEDLGVAEETGREAVPA